MDHAILFGLFRLSSDGGAYVPYCDMAPTLPYPKGLTLDAAFTITALPTLPLSTLTSLARYLDISHVDTAARYELTRKSCIRGFDAGCTPETIVAELREVSTHEVPHNLEVLVADWFAGYSQVTVYRGYVIKVNKEKERHIEQNPHLKERIAEKIAPGIFLLSFANDGEAVKIIEKNLGQDVGRIRATDKWADTRGDASFDPFYASEDRIGKTEGAFILDDTALVIEAPKDEAREFDPQVGPAFIAELLHYLDTLDLPKDQQQELKARIERRVILRPEQLRPGAMRFIKGEAAGLDFPGKLQLIEYAQHKGVPVELGLPSAKGDDRVLGVPVWLEKQAKDMIVTVRVEPGQNFQRYSVGQLSYVRRVPQSIFSG
jgi:hypothetical protein